MSLLMLKTKNLSWQDHTLNIEVMLAPLRSTLLLNKHKTLDTKYDKEKVLYDKQRDSCVKDFVVEKRLIQRRQDKLLKRKKDILAEARAKSAVEERENEESDEDEDSNAKQERGSSAPSGSRPERDIHSQGALPMLTLKRTPLFGGNPLRPRVFLDTSALSGQPDTKQHRSRGSQSSAASAFEKRSVSSKPPSGKKTPYKDRSPGRGEKLNEPEIRAPPIPRRIQFLDFLDDDFNDSDEEQNITVEVKPKTVEEKVRDFLREMDAFNSRPPTACSSLGDRTDDSVTTSRVSSERRVYTLSNLAQDRRILEKSFDRYIDKRRHEDLLKAMKMASKLKSHIRQARNSNTNNMVPTMANFKSSKSFMRLLKRQQRIEQHTPRA